MKKYKVKLQAGDHVDSEGLSLREYENLGNRFIESGCPRLEFPMVMKEGGFPSQKYFGWSEHFGGFYHAGSGAFKGRLLAYSEIMELAEPEASNDWHERGELPSVGDIVEYAGVRGREGRVYDEWREGDRLEILVIKKINDELVPVCFNQRYESVSSMGVEFLRPIKTDRQKAIEKALEFFYIETTDFLGKLYDVGLLKLTEEK